MDGGIQNLIDFTASENFTIDLSREELRPTQRKLQKLPGHFHLCTDCLASLKPGSEYYIRFLFACEDRLSTVEKLV